MALFESFFLIMLYISIRDRNLNLVHYFENIKCLITVLGKIFWIFEPWNFGCMMEPCSRFWLQDSVDIRLERFKPDS